MFGDTRLGVSTSEWSKAAMRMGSSFEMTGGVEIELCEDDSPNLRHTDKCRFVLEPSTSSLATSSPHQSNHLQREPAPLSTHDCFLDFQPLLCDSIWSPPSFITSRSEDFSDVSSISNLCTEDIGPSVLRVPKPTSPIDFIVKGQLLSSNTEQCRQLHQG